MPRQRRNRWIMQPVRDENGTLLYYRNAKHPYECRAPIVIDGKTVPGPVIDPEPENTRS